jgi:mono/diheme cytochrome c family protein
MKCQKLWIFGFLLVGICAEANAHNVGNAITWNREISRIIYQRCASCHREGGTAFSLMKYTDVQPRAVAIKEAVLSRTMPPWGGVKGFGHFRNDQGLSQAELDLITDWVDSNTPKGNNPNVLPKEPKRQKIATFKIPANAVRGRGEFTLSQGMILDGLFPESVPDTTSMKIVAVFPDGRMEPLVWLYEYKNSYQHPFLLREPMDLPAGTMIRGVLPDAKVALIPGKRKKK